MTLSPRALVATLLLLVAAAGLWLGALGIVDPLPRVAAATSTTTSLVLHNTKHATVTSTPLGSTVHPFVGVSASGATPTGKVEVGLYSGGSCAGDPVTTSSQASLSGGVVDLTSFPVSPGVAGQISFRASFLGNATFSRSSSSCVALTVTKATPTVGVEVHDAGHAVVSSVEAGRTAHVRIALSGAAGIPAGNATVRLYTGLDCSGSPTQNIPVAMAPTGIGESSNLSFATPQAHSIDVHYGGSAVYNARTSVCKPISWTKVTPGVTIALHNTIHTSISNTIIGRAVHPRSVVTGPLETPTGTVSIGFYSEAGCTGTGSHLSGVPLVDGTLDNAAQAFTQNVGGTHSVRVHYDGNTLYQAADSPCLDYTVLVISPMTVNIHDQGHAIPVPLVAPESIHPRISMKGVAGFPAVNGELGVILRSTDCEGSAMEVLLGASVVDGIADLSGFSVTLDPGTYAYEATFKGNAVYATSSTCLPFTILAPAATPVPTPSSPAATLQPNPTPTPRVTTNPGSTTAPGESSPPGSTPAPGESAIPGRSSSPGASGAIVPSVAPVASTSLGASPGSTSPGTNPSGGPGASRGPGALAAPAFDFQANVAGLPIFAWLGIALAGAVLILFVGIRIGRRRAVPAPAGDQHPTGPPPTDPPPTDPPPAGPPPAS